VREFDYRITVAWHVVYVTYLLCFYAIMSVDSFRQLIVYWSHRLKTFLCFNW